MWHRDMKWRNAVGKMAMIELLDIVATKHWFVRNSICKVQKAKHNKRYAWMS